MARGNAVKGTRLGYVSLGETEHGEPTPKVSVTYWCQNGHGVARNFASDAREDVPSEWDCPHCGFPAGRDRENPPVPSRVEPFKTHIAYVKERRSESQGQELLDEALRNLRARRGQQES